MVANKRPLIIAHRGASGSSPENTMAAFRKSVHAGADMIELDVRLTQDFHLVVHHDRNVRRTTNGRGNIWDLTLQQLRSLDAGSWFSPKFQRERIPTLREVMEFLLPTRVNLNVEVKTDGDPRKRTHFEECVILIIMEKKFEERTLVSSFDHKFLKHMHELFPGIKTGALYHPVRDVRKKPSTLCSRIGASAFICSRTQLRQRIIDDVRAHKLVLATYGINTPQHFDAILDLGVDAMVTDWPEKMVKRLIS
ncbi:MAG TPA: glycerophosphodiester phosphodiesterase [Bacteroidetes bacterium]|nr:glycerophosphodiester phosphodiesterase [Bacteroidota bacterium]